MGSNGSEGAHVPRLLYKLNLRRRIGISKQFRIEVVLEAAAAAPSALMELTRELAKTRD